MLFAAPVGFHLGVVDAPLAFQVYTDNTCHAVLLPAARPGATVGDLAPLGVHLPRVFGAWFARTGGPGDRMILVDDRPPAGLFGPRERMLRFDDTR